MIRSPNRARINASCTRAGRPVSANSAKAREKRNGVGNLREPLETADASQGPVHPKSVDQRLGGRQVQHGLGHEGPRQGDAILRRTPHEPPAGRDEALDPNELQHADPLFQGGRKGQMVFFA
jgi:hypothetical protein